MSSLLQGSFAKETYNFKEPTNRSHPIARENMYINVYRLFLTFIYVCMCTCMYVYVHMYVHSYASIVLSS